MKPAVVAAGMSSQKVSRMARVPRTACARTPAAHPGMHPLTRERHNMQHASSTNLEKSEQQTWRYYQPGQHNRTHTNRTRQRREAQQMGNRDPRTPSLRAPPCDPAGDRASHRPIAGIFSQWTNQTQEARGYSYDGPIAHLRAHGGRGVFEERGEPPELLVEAGVRLLVGGGGVLEGEGGEEQSGRVGAHGGVSRRQRAAQDWLVQPQQHLVHTLDALLGVETVEHRAEGGAHLRGGGVKGGAHQALLREVPHTHTHMSTHTREAPLRICSTLRTRTPRRL
eukprot:9491140-Pyramimonas_sp.AAC.2